MSEHQTRKFEMSSLFEHTEARARARASAQARARARALGAGTTSKASAKAKGESKGEDSDPWEDLLADVKGTRHRTTNGEEERVATRELFEDTLHLKPRDMKPSDGKRLGDCMRNLGWDGPKKLRVVPKGPSVAGYRRPVTAEDEVVPAEKGEPGSSNGKIQNRKLPAR